MKWFVIPEATRLDLGEGQWIDVKNRLTHGEREGMLAAMSPFVRPGEDLQLDRKEIRTALVSTYLVDWSLKREDGKTVEIGPDVPENQRLVTIRSLAADAFDMIHRAIDAHVGAIQRSDAEKNGPASGASAS